MNEVCGPHVDRYQVSNGHSRVVKGLAKILNQFNETTISENTKVVWLNPLTEDRVGTSDIEAEVKEVFGLNRVLKVDFVDVDIHKRSIDDDMARMMIDSADFVIWSHPNWRAVNPQFIKAISGQGAHVFALFWSEVEACLLNMQVSESGYQVSLADRSGISHLCDDTRKQQYSWGSHIGLLSNCKASPIQAQLLLAKQWLFSEQKAASEIGEPGTIFYLETLDDKYQRFRRVLFDYAVHEQTCSLVKVSEGSGTFLRIAYISQADLSVWEEQDMNLRLNWAMSLLIKYTPIPVPSYQVEHYIIQLSELLEMGSPYNAVCREAVESQVIRQCIKHSVNIPSWLKIETPALVIIVEEQIRLGIKVDEHIKSYLGRIGGNGHFHALYLLAQCLNDNDADRLFNHSPKKLYRLAAQNGVVESALYLLKDDLMSGEVLSKQYLSFASFNVDRRLKLEFIEIIDESKSAGLINDDDYSLYKNRVTGMRAIG